MSSEIADHGRRPGGSPFDRHRFNGWIQADWAAHATVLRYQDFSAGHEEVLTVDQVVERLWDKIVTFVERRSG
jgi:hypothetical protein